MDNTITDYRRIATSVVESLAEYIESSRSGIGKVVQQMPYQSLSDTLSLQELIEEGGIGGSDLENWMSIYLDQSQHMHHPHYMGHQVAVPHLSSGIADLIHGTINNPMAIYEMGPSAAVIEHVIINWLLSKIGWHQGKPLSQPADKAGGILTHGGSMANLTAMLAARARVAPQAWYEGNPTDLCILGSEVAHYSIMRAISIMGLGGKALMPVRTDSREVLDPDDLHRAYTSAMHHDKRIMAVVANACATSTGLYDPLEEIGLFCKENDLWYHVDGAHGASALVSSTEQSLMAGSQMADSMIWDTHKMLRTSTLCAAVLFRDRGDMARAFDQKGSYLFHEKEQVGIDTMAYTVECTKAGLGTKLFWVLAAEGEVSLGDFVASRYQLGRAFSGLIRESSDFETFYEPEANIVCFSYLPAATSNERQLALRNKIVQRGNYYITSTEVNGVRYLRVVLINPDTTLSHLEGLLDEVRHAYAELDT